MKIESGGKLLLDQKVFESAKFSTSVEIQWPQPVYFTLGNKDTNDTLVDQLGNILQDKFIKLESLTVDRLPVHIVALLDCVEIDTGTQNIKTNYWGFNGVAKIEFDRNDTFAWHINNAIKVTASDKLKKTVITQHQDDAGLGTIY